MLSALGVQTGQHLRLRWRQGLPPTACLGLAWLGLQLGQTAAGRACLALLVLLGLLAGMAAWRRARLIADVATSRIGSAAQGLVEVLGTARAGPGELLTSPFSGTPCIWFAWRSCTRDNARSGWRETGRGASHTTFGLTDGSGSCRVDPEHADVIGAEQRVLQRGDEKLVEELLFDGSRIHVLGAFSSLHGATAASSVHEDTGALLADWKRDQAALQRRFDLDGDGSIDPQEWALARRLAQRTVEQQHRQQRALQPLHMLRAPADGQPFLISTLAPQQLRRRWLCWCALHLGMAGLGAALLLGGLP